jgi:predicted small lipoprotein YifL
MRRCRVFLVVALVVAAALSLSACGRKIPLERPSPTPVERSGDGEPSVGDGASITKQPAEN